MAGKVGGYSPLHELEFTSALHQKVFGGQATPAQVTPAQVTAASALVAANLSTGVPGECPLMGYSLSRLRATQGSWTVRFSHHSRNWRRL